MLEIVKSEMFNNMLTVDIKGQLDGAVVGNKISDDNGNCYLLKSVALYGGMVDTDVQTLVLEPIGNFTTVGNYVIV